MHEVVLGGLTVAALLAAAHALGRVFSRLRQPRVIGELLGGALLAPPLLAHVWPELAQQVRHARGVEVATDVTHAVGLTLLMFVSGARMRRLLPAEDRRAVAWLAGLGTCLPFLVAVAAAPRLPLDPLRGRADHELALILVLGVAAAVTSIPVISRIFNDLGLLETRFARLVLAVAVVEDVALWVVLAVALSLADSSGLPWATAAEHVALTLLYVVVALAVMPAAFRRATRWCGNPLARTPTVWLLLLVATSCALAHALGVSAAFGAFFGGLAVGPLVAERGPLQAALERLAALALATAIPAYFAVVGFRLDLGSDLWPGLTAALVASACLVKLASVGLGAHLAGFRGLEVVNLAVATNARGGPGIILASVALEAGIVSAAGYASLIALAVLTSQLAGAWLDLVLRRGWPLLRERAAPPGGGGAPG
ncbi:MAG: cation:proton antiporter [Planctomycetes bacterium]|nr:cation:proton antiporter [Planctomycetota bacterium]